MQSIEKIIERAEQIAERYAELEWLISAPEVIADNRYWRVLLAEYNALAPASALSNLLVQAVQNGDEDEAHKLAKELSEILAIGQAEETAVLEIRAESAAVVFADSLFDAYEKLAQKRGIDFRPITGTRKAELCGAGAYSLLCGENGIHRTAFRTNVRSDIAVVIYLSVASEAVFDKADTKIDVFHSGGAGGQNVNKVETAIRATHLPTGIVVVCKDERSQLMNKERALATLAKKVEGFYKKKNAEAIASAYASALAAVESKKIARIYDLKTNTAENGSANLAVVLSRDGGIADIF